MSSILKALKKLEEEKSILQEKKEIDLSREILKRPAEHRIRVKWLWLSGSSAITIIVILFFALLHKPPLNNEVISRQQPTIIEPAASISPKQTALEPLPLASGTKGVSITPLPSLNDMKRELFQPVLRPTSESSIKKENIELPGPHIPGTEPPKTESTRKNALPATALTTESTFTLTGIAWNKDSADRLAIINGQPMATGATLNGAVIEEILPDRVKLSNNGRTIELLIGRSARTD